MSLKLPTELDELGVLRLCRLFYEESPFFPTVAYNELKIQNLFQQSLRESFSQVLFLLLEDNNTPVGLLVGFATTTPFSDDKIASELAWYVEPSYRGNRKALDLVYAYEAWARQVGCKHVSMSLLTTLTDASKLYERLGYKKTEISYIKEL